MPDDLLTLEEARLSVPGPRPVSLATIIRWHRIGVRGRKLPTVMLAGRRYVSLAALERFVRGDDAQTAEAALTAGGTQ